MDAILRFDRNLFYLINGRLTNPFLDAFMPFMSEKSTLFFIVIVGAVLVLVKGKRKDFSWLVLVVVAVLVSDLLAATLKNVFLRMRPCHALEYVRLLMGCGGSYSFPSGHATNIFSAAVLLSARHARYTPVFLMIAVGVSYSRVYVGVHYPLDVVGGAALGTACALVF